MAGSGLAPRIAGRVGSYSPHGSVRGFSDVLVRKWYGAEARAACADAVVFRLPCTASSSTGHWLQEQNGGRPVRYERVDPGDEQILPPREQRELDALRSGLDRGKKP